MFLSHFDAFDDLYKQLSPFGVKIRSNIVRGHYPFLVARKTVSREEQMMSKDKYSSIFSRQMEAIVFTILQIFLRNVRSFENWEIYKH